MDSHIALRITRTGEQLVLPSDFALDIEEQNPYWNDGGMFTYPGSVPTDENADWLKVIQTLRSAVRIQQLEQDGDGKDVLVDILVDGVPYRQGRIRFDDEQEIDGSIGFSIESVVKSIDDLVAGLNCQDVPVLADDDKNEIGERIGDVKVTTAFRRQYEATFRCVDDHRADDICSAQADSSETAHADFDIQALGYSVPWKMNSQGEKVSLVNVAVPYPSANFCNARVSVKHLERDDEGNEVLATGGRFGPWLVLDADRPQTGVCFYVLYFLDCLFNHLGIGIDHAALTAVGDLCRLAFFTTRCSFDSVETTSYREGVAYTSDNLTSAAAITEWLNATARAGGDMGRMSAARSYGEVALKSLAFANGHVYHIKGSGGGYGTEQGDDIKQDWSGGNIIDQYAYDLISITQRLDISSQTWQAHMYKMMANSGNFPDRDVQAVIDSLWASFGVRFIVDYEKRQAKAVLIRDLYRDHTAPIVLNVLVTDIVPVTERIDGVRMCYSQESDSKEQRDNVRMGLKDYDTIYDYIDYARVDDTKVYEEIMQHISFSDKTCYIDRETGNAYRIKVDKDAKEVTELRPTLFEVAQLKGVEEGRCEDEDNVVELASQFEPVIATDVNFSNEKQTASMGGTPQQVLTVFADDEMKPPHTAMTIVNAAEVAGGTLGFQLDFATNEAYDVGSTDDGNSPLQSHDWGMAVSVMRGGGADASLQDYDENYDGFGNAKWAMTAGDYAMNSDSIDAFGNVYDYNGNNDGIGGGERFSLKVRAYKTVDGEAMIDNADQKGRGLHDTFMAEHVYFLLHRKKYRVTVRCELVELQRITNNWNCRFQVGELVGWVNKITSHVTVEGGMEGAVLEMYCL